MTAVPAPAASRPASIERGRLEASARLLRLELRRNAMLWILPVAFGLFWFTTYRKAMAMPPLWNLRAGTMQSGALVAFICPVVGAAAWMGSRDARRHTTDLVMVTARPRWARRLATWAATACWAVVGYLGCVGVLYWRTAEQAPWGGPLWWPVAVVGMSLLALSALGFAAGTLMPGRFTAPVAAIAAFFVLALSTQLIQGGQSYWQVSPLVTGPWDIGPNAGAATFYPYLPDLSIAQIMFLTGLAVAALGAMELPAWSGGRSLRRVVVISTAAGLLTAATAVLLAGTGRVDGQGMIAIPALHDAANDRPLRYAPVCSHTAIPICVNPAYAGYLATATTALAPVLREIAGLPGAPARISQAAATYRQGAGNTVGVGLAGPSVSGRPPQYRMLLPDQLLGPTMTAGQTADAIRSSAGPAIVAVVVGDGPGATPAQRAVAAALSTSASVPQVFSAPGIVQATAQAPLPAPVRSAARRFAALSTAARRAWLVRHVLALRAGRITLAQLP